MRVDGNAAGQSAGAAAADQLLIAQVLAGELHAFEPIMRRYNQRLYRAARAILRDASEAEDVVQHAYVAAFAHLHQFAGEAAFSTWLTRIVVNEALARLRTVRRVRDLSDGKAAPDWCVGARAQRDPEEDVSHSELVRLLEDAIDGLPEDYRAILMLRDIEDLSTHETAACLSISEEAARVRLHRARTLLREALRRRVGTAARDVFSIGGERCNAIVARALAALQPDGVIHG